MASLYSRLTYGALTASLLLAPLSGRAQEAIATQPTTATPAPAPAAATTASSPAPRPLDDDRYTPPASSTDAAAAPAPAATSSTPPVGTSAPVSEAPQVAPLPPISAPPAPAPAPAATPAPTPTPTVETQRPAPRSTAAARSFVRGRLVADDGGSRPIKVGDGDTVNVIAKRLSISSEALISANKLKKPYALDVGQTLNAPTPKDYVIQTGDTLSGVSRRFGVSPAVLGELNGFDVRERLHAGQKIALPLGFHDAAASVRAAESEPSAAAAPAPPAHAAPDDSEPSPAAPSPSPAPTPPPTAATEPSHPVPYAQAPAIATTPTPTPAPPAAVENEPSPPPERSPPRALEPDTRLSIQGKVVADRQKFREMRVGPGDTVSVISDRLLTPREDLIKLNRLKKPFELDRGQILKIPTPQAYVAESGDTLAGVGKRFGTTAAVLAEINDLDETDRLRPGQKIGLPTDVHDGGPVRTLAPPSRPHYTFESEPGFGRPQPPTRASEPPAYSGPPAADQTPPPSDAEIIAAGKGRFAWPVTGQTLSNFGPKPGGQRNDGVDLAAPLGTPVTAAAEGDVVYAGNLVPGFGNLVLIRHPDGWVTAYAYLARIEVKIRDHVRQGDEIGQVGQTGGVDQPKLHFEIRYAPNAKDKARPIDPTLVLPGR